jgi:trk system potassium uptake protein TrkH
VLAGLNFTQGVFEAMSGLTTTGLSVVDVTAVPGCLLLWRSNMQLAGGAGLAIIMLAVFSLPVGAGLYRAEGRSDQLAPHVRASTRLVLLLYSGYALAGILGYRLAGTSWFDAVNHSFAAISTGGFSTRMQSIGHWDSPAVEAVSVVLMILGNLNFLTAWLLVRGKMRAFLRNGEIRTGAVLLPLCILLLFTIGTGSLYPSLDKRLRVAVFEAVSALTTTGFSTVGYTEWPASAFLVLVVLMLVGGGTCSTAGGIKKLRVYLLFKAVLWEVRRTLLPGRAVAEHSFYQGEDRQFVSDRLLSSIGSFVFLYLATWVAGSLLICCFGYPLGDALFEFASAVGTVGLSIGITSAGTPPAILWAETVGMFLGRLEFFVIFVALGNLAGKLRRR